ncbi:uncharacterized protein LOC110810120 [Carica papaya]|uniref:uncharacterized protein LOC110810120 n=1 Tax=Carica papaya TaxID=3649 RepID=UPI000B8CBA07|nr:uncharacterized protein LOC110810120 [Carica papaya]
MVTQTHSNSIKFLCSYGGKMLPRSSDGALRYVGGLTRVLAVNRSVSFAELMVKLVEFCGFSVTLRCQLPGGDLETLITVKSDEELVYIIDLYHLSAPGTKIRVILSPPNSIKQISPPPSLVSSPKSPFTAFGSPPVSFARFLPRTFSQPVQYSFGFHNRRRDARNSFPAACHYNHRC